jgi:2-deoxy-D-gluconate 3-dehydrogenase
LFDITGKVAIVTGASRGLGRAIAIGLAEAGADIVATDMLDVEETVQDVRKNGRGALGLTVDVTNKNDIEGMVRGTLDRFDKIDILVNNAGIYRTAPSETMSEEDWDSVVDINLKGEFLCAQEAGKVMMRAKSGKIVNISSVAGQFASAQSVSYCASKAGIILMTKTLAVEWARYNIQVNAICPGVFVTPMTENLLEDKNFRSMIEARVPAARPGKPEELVGAAVFLSSKASDYMTGHALVIDGGWTAEL